MSHPIVPPSYANGIPRIQRAGFIMLVFPAMFILLWYMKAIPLVYCIVFSGIFAIIIFYMLFLSVRYYGIAVSRVVLYDDRIEIHDHHGNAWRVIHCSCITDVRIIEIDGFMHGYHGVSGIAKYIVVFTNGCTSLPENSFIEKYRDPNYFPIYYQREVWEYLQARIGSEKCRGGCEQIDR